MCIVFHICMSNYNCQATIQAIHQCIHGSCDRMLFLILSWIPGMLLVHFVPFFDLDRTCIFSGSVLISEYSTLFPVSPFFRFRRFRFFVFMSLFLRSFYSFVCWVWLIAEFAMGVKFIWHIINLDLLVSFKFWDWVKVDYYGWIYKCLRCIWFLKLAILVKF